jgi:hypothetical protein
MRILRVRTGFQADHSSSSYLFYAVDGKVSEKGKKLAETFSSSAEVDDRSVYYHKYGESELRNDAYRALLGQHYDVMAGESYDSWYLWIAVPRTPEMKKLLEPFSDVDDGGYRRLTVYDYGKRLAVEIFCEFEEDEYPSLETMVKRLGTIRSEILQGDVSFLQGVAHFYVTRAGEDEDEEDEDGPGEEIFADWSKPQLQEECERRGIDFRKSWTRDQLREALTSPVPGSRTTFTKPKKLSPAARRIVNRLDYRG